MTTHSHIYSTKYSSTLYQVLLLSAVRTAVQVNYIQTRSSQGRVAGSHSSAVETKGAGAPAKWNCCGREMLRICQTLVTSKAAPIRAWALGVLREQQALSSLPVLRVESAAEHVQPQHTLRHTLFSRHVAHSQAFGTNSKPQLTQLVLWVDCGYGSRSASLELIGCSSARPSSRQ